MAEKTKISWCHHTFNFVLGCSRIAKGCLNCYAEELMANRYHRVKWGPKGTRSKTKTWNDPIRWNKEALEAGENRKVFCCSLADVFEDFNGVITDSKQNQLWRDKEGRYSDCNDPNFQPYEVATFDHLRVDLFKIIDKTPNLSWLLLTKRPENILNMWTGKYRDNVWLGTSIADQSEVDKFIQPLLTAKHLAKYLFLSAEPQISNLDLKDYLFPSPLVDWVICGGESKQGKEEPRPFDTEWARFSVNQCRQAGVPFFLKQFGSVVYDNGNRIQMSTSHGDVVSEWPAELRVRECPETYFPRLAVA
jgi:protein gp37